MEKLRKTIAALESRLKRIEDERGQLIQALHALKHNLSDLEGRAAQPSFSTPSIEEQSSMAEKIKLFRGLFRGREDVYPKFWESKKNGKKGYSPVCEREWIKGVCRKPAIKCGECKNRKFSPLTDEVMRRHLLGAITIGVYAMLEDETCYFLAIDFDKEHWQDDAKAFRDTCREKNIPALLERSRSGNGGHVWILFSEPVASSLARQMGSLLITETMSNRSELEMRSYDRLFPNQDTMPKGGFGSLIALPLQKLPMVKGNSLFLDENLKPYPDQWAYLAGVRKMSLPEVRSLVDGTLENHDNIEIAVGEADEETKPWAKTPTSRQEIKRLSGKMPSTLNIILANRVYIKKDDLPPSLFTALKRLAAFQNPEFYKKQSLRLYTGKTTRVICCAEMIDNYLAIPRGCLERLTRICSVNDISLNVQEERFAGNKVDLGFQGELTEVQREVSKDLLNYETGVCVAPPGLGKTVIGIQMIAARAVNTLVLVHRKPLLEQWRAQISAFLGLGHDEIGQIGGGKDKATNVIDVAMLQSLNKKEGVDPRIKNYGQIIVDECHHIAAFSFEKVMMEAQAKYVVGLTATPYRRDGHQPIITMQCGPVRHKITSLREMAATSFSLSPRMITRTTDFFCPWSDEDKIHKLWPLLVVDEARNKMIIDDILKALEERRSPIVLTERKKHLEILKGALGGSVKNLIVLHGGMKSKNRKEMVARLKEIPAGEERLIIATGQYIGEGFDDPRLDTLFLTMPVSFRGKIVQYAGRLNRLYEGKKETRIYDYKDVHLPILLRMYEKRLRQYKKLGYEEIKP
ncbi:MAG: DEAD/DEAH box helicase family protein [Candidatus Tectomicrobia bacterium]|uniref:DEAD/DEAH box helicase family protein n=1 Tax=Tectimicrobiota bacterium TaxID=2528274 RepID=A0A933GPJ7_UNCTE|nr:DEAD/DEAH box helicase family protein [Candidatus Tectomicrobia bacterium]